MTPHFSLPPNVKLHWQEHMWHNNLYPCFGPLDTKGRNNESTFILLIEKPTISHAYFSFGMLLVITDFVFNSPMNNFPKELNEINTIKLSLPQDDLGNENKQEMRISDSELYPPHEWDAEMAIEAVLLLKIKPFS